MRKNICKFGTADAGAGSIGTLGDQVLTIGHARVESGLETLQLGLIPQALDQGVSQ